jgi:LmbE family N-acetylglucosaminyl deacetylase
VMFDLFRTRPRRPSLQVLCLGAHCDDIEIGCGGTLLRMTQELPPLDVRWLVFSSTPEREGETRRAAQLFLRAARSHAVVVHRFRDGFFPYHGAQIKDSFEDLKRTLSPDVIFTHHRHDLHQDHRLISELTWNTFRAHLILEYEIVKYDGDLGSPNVFVSLSAAHCRRKIQTILRCFKSQQKKPWFREDVFRAMLHLRGVESHSPTGFAEGLYGRKLVL